MSSGAPIADAQARAEALDVSRSFIVQAPAGSGKTELLIQRHLALLATASRPEAVVALTFTKKAAGEMRERLINALEMAAGDAQAAAPHEETRLRLARAVLERDRELGWDLLRSAHRLQISTIDSLCARLVAGLPLLASFGGQPRIADNPQVLYREAVRRALAHAAGDPALEADLERSLSRREMRASQLEDQLVDLLGRREQWTREALEAREPDDADALLDRIERGLERAIAESWRELDAVFTDAHKRSIDALATETRDALAAKGKDSDWPTLGGTMPLSGADVPPELWREVRALLLTNSGSVRGKTAYKGGDSVVERWSELRDWLLDDERAAKALKDSARIPAGARFETETREALKSLFRLMLLAHAELWRLFRSLDASDFSEVSQRAIEALGSGDNPGELLEALDRRIEHLLIDEFQDTSVSQADFVRRLTAGWSADDGRTLFAVGDPMQSIYRFRKAEVGLFLAARSEAGLFENVRLEPLTLSVNFRSQPAIVDWVNRVFSILMGDEDDDVRGAVGFSRSSARPGLDPGPEPEMFFFGGERDAADEPVGDSVIEAEGLAALIADELVPEADEAGGEVAILAKSRAAVADLIRSLEARGIAYRSEGLDRLIDRPVIRDLISLTRLLVHRGDRLSGLALLRSPLVGLSVAEIAHLAEPDAAAYKQARDAQREAAEPGSPPRLRDVEELIDGALGAAETPGLSGDARARLTRFAAVISAVRRELGRRRLVDLVEGAWIALGGASVQGEAGVVNAQAYFDLLASVETAGSVDLTELDRQARELSAPAEAGDAANVVIMTMHASKGLEFDTVVLPALSKGTNGGSGQAIAFETDPRTGHMNAMAISAERGREHPDDKKHKLIQTRENVRGDMEQLRLLYVAATRAKRRLVLSAPLPSRRKSDDAFSAKGFVAELRDAIELEDVSVRTVSETGVGQLPRLARPPAQREPFAIPPAVRTVSVDAVAPSAAPESDEADPMALRFVSPVKRHAGTVAHAWLERIAEVGPERFEGEADSDAARARIGRALSRLGTPEGDVAEGTELVEQAIRETLGDATGRWILGAHESAHSEYRLTQRDATGDVESTETNASLDRTFVEDGCRYIVDYKVVAPGSGEDRKAFLDTRFEAHREQLERYGELMAASDPGTEIRLGIYFPLLGDSIWWNPGSETFEDSPR